MFSSGKFLSPIVTAGLPAPGPLDAVVEAVLDDVLELLEEELLLPHAAKPNATAPTLISATIPRPISLKLRERLSGISRLVMYRLLACLFVDTFSIIY
jgi:hypothetical protein